MQGSYRTKCPVAVHPNFSSLKIVSVVFENISSVIPLGNKAKKYLIQTFY